VNQDDTIIEKRRDFCKFVIDEIKNIIQKLFNQIKENVTKNIIIDIIT